MAHAALAQVLTDQPDRSIWHLAASIVGPHEILATELEATATRAQHRGAIAVAVAALDRAAQLRAHPYRQISILLRVAELAFELGRYDLVNSLLHAAEQLDLGPHE